LVLNLFGFGLIYLVVFGFRDPGVCGVWIFSLEEVEVGGGFRVQGLGFRVQGLAFRGLVAGFRGSVGFRVQGFGFRKVGRFRVQGLGFRV
jgi:hypothetical protein